MRWLGGLIFLFALGVTPVAAHKLRVFAFAEGAIISGYGFFVGGGRAGGIAVTLSREGMADPFAVTTSDPSGQFRFETPHAGRHVVRVNSGDGHVAEAPVIVTIGAPAPSTPQLLTPPPPTAVPATSPPSDTPDVSARQPICLDDAVLRALIATAVAREIRPLAERIEAADARLRLTDIAGGLGTILGLAGLALWARAKRLIGPPG